MQPLQPTTTQEPQPDPHPSTLPHSTRLIIVRLVMAVLAIIIVLYLVFILIPTLIRPLFPGTPTQVGSVVSPAQTWNIGSPVTAVGISPDGQTVAVGLEDGNLQV